MAEGAWRSQGPTGPPGVTRQASDRRVEPPLVVQNAMLTKDKKPFTYTPGGIDLSEIRSPRMARRIERNANAPGVGDMPRTSPPRGPTGPLPPSALAAMQPALPVQVFPVGAPPPPPPPPVNIPPPPPMEPIPTKPIATNEGIFERPDMTKIIPENPMALLRKTGGVNRRSFIEEPGYSEIRPNGNNQQDYVTAQVSMPAPQIRPMVQNQHQIPPPVQPVQPPMQATPQFMQPKPQMAQAPRQEPLEQQQELKTSTAQLGSLYIPPLNSENQKGPTGTPPAKVATPPGPSQKNAQSPGTPQSPMATLHRSPRPWQTQKPPLNEVPQWAQRSYSPPEVDEPETPVSEPAIPANYQQRVAQSPVPQQAQQPSPQRIPQSPGWNQQQRSQQSPNVQSNVIGRVIIPVQVDVPPGSQNPNVEAVYVTQPIVLQHPGPRPDAAQQQIKQKEQVQQQQQQQRQQQQQHQVVQNQQQTQRTDSRGVRVIPIQIEGSATNNNVQRQESNYSNPSTGSATPGTAKTFTRQPSWSPQGPVQSNSFKLLQKITNTDGDEDEDEESTEHSPRRAQQFEQNADQVRKMKLSEDDQEFMNKLKQVPRNTQPGNQGPNVRTIPVQVEGDGAGKPYVPPSEQTVQEPKKYTGGKIPSRSFKVLQAMTGEACGPDQSDL